LSAVAVRRSALGVVGAELGTAVRSEAVAACFATRRNHGASGDAETADPVSVAVRAGRATERHTVARPVARDAGQAESDAANLRARVARLSAAGNRGARARAAVGRTADDGSADSGSTGRRAATAGGAATGRSARTGATTGRLPTRARATGDAGGSAGDDDRAARTTATATAGCSTATRAGRASATISARADGAVLADRILVHVRTPAAGLNERQQTCDTKNYSDQAGAMDEQRHVVNASTNAACEPGKGRVC